MPPTKSLTFQRNSELFHWLLEDRRQNINITQHVGLCQSSNSVAQVTIETLTVHLGHRPLSRNLYSYAPWRPTLRRFVRLQSYPTLVVLLTTPVFVIFANVSILPFNQILRLLIVVVLV
jgi:hypothetical protein